MKAYSLHNINDLRYEDIAYPSCPPNWCIVRVKAAGICSSDIPRIFKKGTYHFPTIPGHEFSGVVEQIGEGVSENWIGKRVGVFPLIPCRQCASCKDHKYEMCDHYDYIGSRRDGAFAEFVAVPEWNLIEIPNEISFTEAAMLEPLAVALHAVKRGEVSPKSSVAIVGTGMIGFAAAQWAKMIGAGKTTVYGRSDSKQMIAEKIPDINYEVYSGKDLQSEYDIVIEAVGNSESVNTAVQLSKTGGRIVLMGNPSGNITLDQNIYWKILRKQIEITGTWNSSYESEGVCDWTEVIIALENRQIVPDALISHKFSQVDLWKGLEIMKDHTAPYCKIMTIWNEG